MNWKKDGMGKSNATEIIYENTAKETTGGGNTTDCHKKLPSLREDPED